MPTDESQLHAVFPGGGADWALWSDVATRWQRSAARQGFERQEAASAQDVLDSLRKDKNVIVVVAHANRQVVYMPAPPPKGSQLSTEQIMERKPEITANRPVVYLFCCETAEISGLTSFSQVLLDAGAAAVVAPQGKIDAERSVDFLEDLIRADAGISNDLMTRFKVARRQSKYHEMEVWLG